MIFIGKYTYRNMNKKLIRLTESDLHRIVRESVNNVLNELEHKRSVKYDPTVKNPSRNDYDGSLYDKKTQMDIDWHNFENSKGFTDEYVSDNGEYVEGYNQWDGNVGELYGGDGEDGIFDRRLYQQGQSPSFYRDGKGKEGIDTLRYLDKGGEYPDYTRGDIKTDLYNHMSNRKYQNNRIRRNAKDADKRWMKAADSRPLHSKGSLNRA